MKRFGTRVRQLRKARGMSQEEVGEKADLHYTYVGGIERGERNPSLKSINKIAGALEVDIGELFTALYHEDQDEEAGGIESDIRLLLLNMDAKKLRLVRLIIKDVEEWLKENNG